MWLEKLGAFGKKRYASGFWDGLYTGAALLLSIFLIVMTVSYSYYNAKRRVKPQSKFSPVHNTLICDNMWPGRIY